MVSGIVAIGSVPSAGPNDLVFEHILSDLRGRDNPISATGAQPVVPGIKNDVEWTALAAVRPGNGDDM